MPLDGMRSCVLLGEHAGASASEGADADAAAAAAAAADTAAAAAATTEFNRAHLKTTIGAPD